VVIQPSVVFGGGRRGGQKQQAKNRQNGHQDAPECTTVAPAAKPRKDR
jgi:hypothetical protein